MAEKVAFLSYLHTEFTGGYSNFVDREYSQKTITQIHKPRALGKTDSEIKLALQLSPPESSLSCLTKGVSLSAEYSQKIATLKTSNLSKGRPIALNDNKTRREMFLQNLNKLNFPVARKVNNKEAAKIAPARLCRGEASEYSGRSDAFTLGSSGPRIIIMLRRCSSFRISKARRTVHAELVKIFTN